MKILALSPARMGSSRFPGKPLAPILGKPMVGHVYERVAQSPLLEQVAVATCDQEIYDYVESIGGVAVMTSDRHERASDRCAEALLKL
ncbi:MAG: NTP transferase domain-containing protein, partial [Planctomycetes bacterium]|nr:NTP transferase domain-containing protein [Planctomycetota bacterium]